MNKNMLKGLMKSSLLLPIRIVARILLSLQTEPSARRLFGTLFDQFRLNSHENYVASTKLKYSIHPTVYWGEDTLIYGDGSIEIGENSYIGRNSYILSHPSGVKLKIGSNCAISHGVHIRTEVNKKKKHYQQDIASEPKGADVIIGDYVWIGAHVFIGGGITVGNNSIIGANSVVTRDVPPDSVFAGVPARFIRNKHAYRDDASAGDNHD